ncbi:hypothetical protein F5882DRAFT_401846 [Hyaloscypha sp. PMI_1271]|nr:hypothetical protein F5882DRAFT_401846 [Hyaloscypha sp. PMI_1271]
MALYPRSISADTKVNLIIGIFTIVTGVLSTLLAWAMWKLTRAGSRRRAHESPTVDSGAIELMPRPRPRSQGYEVALRFGRTP